VNIKYPQQIIPSQYQQQQQYGGSSSVNQPKAASNYTINDRIQEQNPLGVFLQSLSSYYPQLPTVNLSSNSFLHYPQLHSINNPYPYSLPVDPRANSAQSVPLSASYSGPSSTVFSPPPNPSYIPPSNSSYSIVANTGYMQPNTTNSQSQSSPNNVQLPLQPPFNTQWPNNPQNYGH
jgi:hypothetical protein